MLDETRELYFTDPARWQVIEERVDASSDPNRQFVWGMQYVDALIHRDRDTSGDGVLDERLYAIQDANWNVTSLVDSTGSVQERYAFSAYGSPAYLNATFGIQGSSNYEWERLFAAYRWDASLGCFLVRNRAYSPALGVWLQRDPLGHSNGFNLYEYVAGQPTVHFDPYGLFLCSIAKAFNETFPCLCAFVQAVDTIVSLILEFLAVPAIPPFSPIGIFLLILNGLDCLCDFLALEPVLCRCSPGFGGVLIGLGTAVSCGVDLIDSFLTVFDRLTPEGDEMLTLWEAVSYATSQLGSQASGLRECFAQIVDVLSASRN